MMRGEDTVNTTANQEQVRYWNEQGGPRWVQRQQQLDAQINQLGLVAMQAASLQPGEHVLDVGCGCGQTSLELTESVSPSGSVLGVDLSQPMLTRARERRDELKLTNLEFLNADAQTHRFALEHFDLVFSRFGVMFFEDPTAAFTNLQTALRPDGRLCFVCWQTLEKNEWARIPLMAAAKHVPLPAPSSPDAPGPFAFANPDRVRRLLETAGFTHINIESQEAALTMGGAATVDEAVDFVMEIGPIARLLADASVDVRARVVEELRATLASYATREGVNMSGAAWIVYARPCR
jgi:ubiquinone/menaquinone biosynthesis C-methylase UbiE